MKIGLLLTVYWVSPSGSDFNIGTQNAPFLTVQRSARATTPGDMVIVRDGIYSATCASTGLNQVDLITSGTAASPITFKAENYRQAILDSANTCGYGFKVHIGANYNIVDGFVIQNQLIGGIQAQGNNDSYLRLEIRNIGNVEDVSTTSAHVGIITYQASDSTLIDSGFIHYIGRTNTLCPDVLCTPRDQNLYLEGTNITVSNTHIVNKGMGWSMALKVGSGYNIFGDTLENPAGQERQGQIVIGDDLHTNVGNFTIRNMTFIQPQSVAIVACGAAITGSNSIQDNTASGQGVVNVFGGDICSASTGLTSIVQSNNLVMSELPFSPSGLIVTAQ